MTPSLESEHSLLIDALFDKVGKLKKLPPSYLRLNWPP
jgi:hypothetical protein